MDVVIHIAKDVTVVALGAVVISVDFDRSAMYGDGLGGVLDELTEVVEGIVFMGSVGEGSGT